MNWTRSITLLFATLLQVWPAWAVVPSSPSSATCSMACCAWQADAATVSCCGCETELPTQAPANTPPASGRDLLPAVNFFETDTAPFSPAPAPCAARFQAWATEPTLTTAPHVRLAVLHCSFLT